MTEQELIPTPWVLFPWFSVLPGSRVLISPVSRRQAGTMNGSVTIMTGRIVTYLNGNSYCGQLRAALQNC